MADGGPVDAHGGVDGRLDILGVDVAILRPAVIRVSEPVALVWPMTVPPLMPPPAKKANCCGQWSRPAAAVSGPTVRPNSPTITTSVLSSRPLAFSRLACAETASSSSLPLAGSLPAA